MADREPDANVGKQPRALDALLATLDRDQLRRLLLRLTEGDPALATVIRGEVSLLQATPVPVVAPVPAVDTKAIRREVRDILRSLNRMRASEAYWHVGSVVNDVREVLNAASAQIRANEGRSALAILDAITEEYVAGWFDLDDSNAEASGFFPDLEAAWTEAFLVANLDPDERAAWAEKLDAWAEEVEKYGVEDAFWSAEQADVLGWDDPSVRGANEEADAADEDWWAEESGLADDLLVARLNVLERQGRYEEFLQLAARTRPKRHATMLVRLGRTDEAVAAGRQRLSTASEAHDLATALHERGESGQALDVAEHGLTLLGPKAPLAVWLHDLAGALGEPERALAAAVVAFEEAPDLAAYRRVQTLAGDGWPQRRADFLARLRRGGWSYPVGPVEVFLHEGLIDAAIAAAEGSYSYTLIEQVVEAAATSRPDWAIQASRGQTEPIIGRAQAKYYHHAARWLAHARDAYRAAGRDAEWRAYLAELIADNQRKSKLRPLLEALRDDAPDSRSR